MVLRILAVLTIVLGILPSAAQPASAAVAIPLEKPTSGSAALAEPLVGKNPQLSEEATRENIPLRYDLASDSPVAAKGIGWTGKIGEDALKNLGGTSNKFFRTSQGARFVDQFANGIANESKVGYQSLTQNLAAQISKDAELIQSGQIQGATWHFFTSPVTGLGGPSAPLAEALRQAGIQFIVH